MHQVGMGKRTIYDMIQFDEFLAPVKLGRYACHSSRSRNGLRNRREKGCLGSPFCFSHNINAANHQSAPTNFVKKYKKNVKKYAR